MSLARLDHVIYSVPDIEAAHRKLTARFPEAWSVGRFWPDSLTSGVALGGINLELIQFDLIQGSTAKGTTLVFQPTTFEEAVAAFARAGIPALVMNKHEKDPELLRLRGFSELASLTPKWICRILRLRILSLYEALALTC